MLKYLMLKNTIVLKKTIMYNKLKFFQKNNKKDHQKYYKNKLIRNRLNINKIKNYIIFCIN